MQTIVLSLVCHPIMEINQLARVITGLTGTHFFSTLQELTWLYRLLYNHCLYYFRKSSKPTLCSSTGFPWTFTLIISGPGVLIGMYFLLFPKLLWLPANSKPWNLSKRYLCPACFWNGTFMLHIQNNQSYKSPRYIIDVSIPVTDERELIHSKA